jgi:hypothetical protein
MRDFSSFYLKMRELSSYRPASARKSPPLRNCCTWSVCFDLSRKAGKRALLYQTLAVMFQCSASAPSTVALKFWTPCSTSAAFAFGHSGRRSPPSSPLQRLQMGATIGWMAVGSTKSYTIVALLHYLGHWQSGKDHACMKGRYSVAAINVNWHWRAPIRVGIGEGANHSKRSLLELGYWNASTIR